MAAPDIVHCRCCIVGGGPAGMMLGLLLARAGVDVVVLEKHGDFLRDFRGDTIHPSTLEVMHELGLLERFLALPHQEVAPICRAGRRQARHHRRFHPSADAAAATSPCMPQWDFLELPGAARAKRYPGFHAADGSRGDRT